MADYPTLAATLAALNSTKNDPQGTEAANKLDDSIRQTRVWLYDFLTTLIDPSNNKLKTDAFVSGSLPAGLIRGSNPTDSAQREILQGSIQTIDLNDDAVTAQKIKDGTIVAGNIAASTITGDKLADGTIGLEKLASQIIATASLVNQAVTSDKLADGSVLTAKLALSAVTTEKIQNFAVSGRKLEAASEGFIMVGGNGAAGNEFAPKALSGAITVDKNGLARFASLLSSGELGYVFVAETAAPGTDGSPGGTPTKEQWNARGVTPGNPWAVTTQSRSLVQISGEKLYFIEDGSYLITASAPGYKVKAHKARLKVVPDGALTGEEHTVYYSGQSAYSGGGVNVMTRTEVTALVVMGTTGDSIVQRPYISLEHWIGDAAASNKDKTWGVSGTGDTGDVSVPSTLNEHYATVSILKLA